MAQLQENILDFIENDENVDENFQKLTDNISNYNISTNEPLLVEFLHLIVNISNNHNRNLNFYAKIERILILFKDEIKILFSNLAILYFFISNKRLLLFLIKEQILIFDSTIYNEIKFLSKPNYDDNEIKISDYFYTEMKSFTNVKNDEIEENLSLFEERRTIGENHHLICKLIREDLIDDFIIYVNKNNISVKSEIDSSIYETNAFLIGKKPTLIEYAAFYGSIQIFQYLCINGAEITPKLLEYAIHSNNAEIFYLVQENDKLDSYSSCLEESIKCHHNSITKYIIDNLYDTGDFCKLGSILFESFNYSMMVENKIYPDVIATFEYDYAYLSELLLKCIDVNDYIIKSLMQSSNYSNEEKKFPFIIAVSHGNYEIVKILSNQKNIDINRKYLECEDCYETTVLFKAIVVQRPDIVELLLNNENISVNLEVI